MPCGTTCAVALPTINKDACNNINELDGGINRVLIAKCSLDLATLVDAAAYSAAVTSGDLTYTGLIHGDKGIGSPSAKTMSSCSPDKNVSAEKTIHWEDFNHDITTSAEFTEITAYNLLMTSTSTFLFAIIDCDDNVTGWIDGQKASFFADVMIEDTVDGSRYIDATLSYKQLTMLDTTNVSGLNAVLSAIDTVI